MPVSEVESSTYPCGECRATQRHTIATFRVAKIGEPSSARWVCGRHLASLVKFFGGSVIVRNV